ncbi:MAG TPA: tetratricopeptide repeat protein [Caulobacteraceae bacterium]
MAHDVFISYSPQDKLTADAACAVLEAAGIRCWIAPRDVTPGSEWSESIIDAIAEVRAFVLVFSAHANESGQVKREVERAVHQGIPIVPFRIEDVPPTKSLEYFISTPHWLDAFSPPLQEHLTHLAQILRTLLDADATERLAPPGPVPRPTPAILARVKPWWIVAGAAVAVLVAAIVLRPAPKAPSGPAPSTNAAPSAPQPPGYAPTPQGASTAGMSPDWVACVTNPDQRIRAQACTSLIESGHESRRNLAVAFFNRGSAFDNSGEHQLAVDDDTWVLRVQPNDQETLTNRGIAYAALDEYPQALTDLNRAIGLQPNNPIALDNRGRVYMDQGQYDLAIADLNQSIHLDPNRTAAFINRCAARARQNQALSQAMADCNIGLTHAPGDPDGLDARGLVYLRMGQPDQAIADFSAALKADPRRASSLYGRAVATKAKTGQTDGSDVGAAQALDPTVAAKFAGFGMTA